MGIPADQLNFYAKNVTRKNQCGLTLVVKIKKRAALCTTTTRFKLMRMGGVS